VKDGVKPVAGECLEPASSGGAVTALSAEQPLKPEIMVIDNLGMLNQFRYLFTRQGLAEPGRRLRPNFSGDSSG